MGVGEVEHDHNGIAVFVVESEEGAEAFLAGGVPDVHGEGVAAGVGAVVAVEAGAQRVGHLVLEVAVQQHLDYACFADV